ncbi:protein D3-like isoform X4 [Homarus americanus]|uniref:protein D3-like isoform X4 n=1 Tax=Homarus americanus TaxID=6706 RepID=UPI001C43D9BC|nr:protein D3-like isoform X4 [Homarus americanus]
MVYFYVFCGRESKLGQSWLVEKTKQSTTHYNSANFSHEYIRRTMEQHQVVPDVVDVAPSALVQVKYGEAEVNSGNELTPTQVVSLPTHLSWPREEGALYTLCMTDPDAPSRKDPKFREFLHWLVVNVPSCDPASGDTIAHFVGSGPPRDTGLHRYVYLVYRQPGPLTCDEPNMPNNSAEHRRSFSIRNFANKYHLQLVAGNLYQAQYDATCDLVHQQLGVQRR